MLSATQTPKETQGASAIAGTTPPTDQSTRTIHCEGTALPDGNQQASKRRRTSEHESSTDNLYSITETPNIPLDMTTNSTDSLGPMLWMAGLGDLVPQPDKPGM
jgi:hypothetical protein